jgi:outer membrane protein assembly factor BamB
VKNPRKFAAGLLLAGIALLTASCGGIVNPQGWASPALDGSSAYYLQNKDHLAAITLPAEGNAPITWTFPDKNKPDQKDLSLKAIYATPVVDGDTVYGASYSGAVFAINKADGNLKWIRKDLSGGVVGGIAVSGDFLAVGTVDNHLYLLKKSDHTSAPGWPADGITLKDAVWAQPVIKGDSVYVATMGGDVFALDLANGQKKWTFHASGAIADLARLDDTRLFVPSLNKQVYIVNMADGKAPNGGFQASDWVWTRPAVKDGVVYFGDFSGSIYAVDITTGKGLWTYAGGNKVKAAPAIVQDIVVVADRKPLVHFIDARTGAAKEIKPLLDAGTVRADVIPSADGATAIISSTNGKLYRADPKALTVNPIPVGSGQ